MWGQPPPVVRLPGSIGPQRSTYQLQSRLNEQLNNHPRHLEERRFSAA
jgi:hypothetical protein